MRTIRFIFLAALALLTGLATGEARAAELKVLAGGAMRAALQELAPAFEAASKHKLVIEFATAAEVEKRVAEDDTIDVAILTKPRMDKLVLKARIVGGSLKTLASGSIGLAVKKGAPKPDISSVEAFKKALLSAKSIAYGDPASGGTSGIHLAQVAEKLGIAAELKPKTKLVPTSATQPLPPVGEMVQRGEAEIGMMPISQLMEVQGIDIAGPLPAELQTPDFLFVAGSSHACEQPLVAKALIDFLGGPEAKKVYQAKGLQPPS